MRFHNVWSLYYNTTIISILDNLVIENSTKSKLKNLENLRYVFGTKGKPLMFGIL
jgi:hypothetical protein